MEWNPESEQSINIIFARESKRMECLTENQIEQNLG